MIWSPKRFRCPKCRKVLERHVHGNVRKIQSWCSKHDKDVTLRRVK